MDPKKLVRTAAPALLIVAGLVFGGMWTYSSLERWTYQTSQSKRLDQLIETRQALLPEERPSYKNLLLLEDAAPAARESLSVDKGAVEKGKAGKGRKSLFGMRGRTSKDLDVSDPEAAAPEPRVALATRRLAGESGLVGRIEIPRLKVSAVIADGIDRKTLRRAVGRVPGTAFPGESGNVGIAGHRDSFFRGLKDAEENDVIQVVTPDGRFTYVIESISIVKPDRIGVLAPTDSPVLTLVTCYPFHFVGRAPDRFIVRARQTDESPLASR